MRTVQTRGKRHVHFQHGSHWFKLDVRKYWRMLSFSTTMQSIKRFLQKHYPVAQLSATSASQAWICPQRFIFSAGNFQQKLQKVVEWPCIL